jgi:rSAM/selenodomain-associated transferase 1
MTKAPIIGSVKSRLGAEIGEQHAAEIYKRFLMDIVETLNRFGEDFIIYYTPEDALDLLIDIFGIDMQYIPQTGRDLGERLYNGLDKARELGYQYAIALASDVPDLNVDYLREAIESLKKDQLVIGPSSDGGYNLIGYDLSINNPSLYDGINWGTAEVYEETLKRLHSVEFHVLPFWGDVDELSDLRKCKLDQNSHTYSYLRENRLL